MFKTGTFTIIKVVKTKQHHEKYNSKQHRKNTKRLLSS